MVGWPDGYPLGRSSNPSDLPDIAAVGTDLPTDTTSQTVALPDSGEGAILAVVLKFSSSDAVPGTPSGWNAPGVSGSVWWFWKIADGTEGPSLALTLAVARHGAAYAIKVGRVDRNPPYISTAAANVNAGVQVTGLDQPDFRGRAALDVALGGMASSALPQAISGYTMEGQICSAGAQTAWAAVAPVNVTDDLPTLANSQGGSTPSWNTRRFLFMAERPNGRIRQGVVGADYLYE